MVNLYYSLGVLLDIVFVLVSNDGARYDQFHALYLLTGLYSVKRIRSQHEIPEKIVTHLQRLHHIFLPILYIPMLYIFGYLLSCNSGNLVLYPTEKCWTIEGGLSVVTLSITILVGAFNSVLYDKFLNKTKIFQLFFLAS